MSRFEINEAEYEAIRRAEKETKDKNISRRLKVLMMRYEGYKVREIADRTGMRINSISQLCRRYREQGLEEFKRNKATSHRYALPIEKELEILSRFEKAAEAGQAVTAKDIKAAFDEERGKDTGRGYIYMLLKRHGWRKVMPRPRHPKAASEEACEASKKLKPMCWKPEKTCPQSRSAECG
ncbi:MAG: hypothetical protein GX934_16825 [Burkholderiales bacterium]|nr:hypothetical protein [Burkholderiales bacterium]